MILSVVGGLAFTSGGSVAFVGALPDKHHHHHVSHAATTVVNAASATHRTAVKYVRSSRVSTVGPSMLTALWISTEAIMI